MKLGRAFLFFKLYQSMCKHKLIVRILSPNLLSIMRQEQREVFDYMFPNPIEWDGGAR